MSSVPNSSRRCDAGTRSPRAPAGPLAEIVDNDACIEDRLLPQPANFGAKRRLARRFDEGLLLEVELVDVQR